MKQKIDERNDETTRTCTFNRLIKIIKRLISNH